MAAAFKWLNRADVSGPKLANTVRTLYTVPVATTAIVKEVVATNNTSSPTTITLYGVKAGGTAADYVILNADDLASNETRIFSLNCVLEATDTLQGLCGTNLAVSVHVSGLEVG